MILVVDSGIVSLSEEVNSQLAAPSCDSAPTLGRAQTPAQHVITPSHDDEEREDKTVVETEGQWTMVIRPHKARKKSLTKSGKKTFVVVVVVVVVVDDDNDDDDVVVV